MFEQLLGKTRCYEECEIEHHCFGGYLSEARMCDKEVNRVVGELRKISGVTQVYFAPQNIKGLRFLFRKNGKPASLKMEGGIIERVKQC